MGRRRARDDSPSRERFEYDERLVDVSHALENLDRPGGCFVSGSIQSSPLPGLEIRVADEPAELLALPLTEDAAAQRVIAKCRLAPYGHGEKTIVDTNVRNTWELNASELAITNPEWQPFVQDILHAIRAPLGIAEAAHIEAKLYKLLVYETGGKFERHQDSEKEPGMFGTLVVVLPCSFTGGELLVHDPAVSKREPHVWNPGEMSLYDVKYAAFYGDCAHEVKAVTSGYRVCLTYNLVTTTVAEIPRFAGSSKVQENIEWTLAQFFTEPLAPKQPRYSWSMKPTAPASHRHFVYILEHDYSDQGLRFEYLKNKDHLVAQSLAKFCEETKGEYVLYLSKLHYSHVSDPDVPDVEAEITVTLQSPWVKYGSTRATKCPDVDVEHLEEVAPSGYLEDVDFDDVETEYTGNEGTREDQWYDTAALVIQPILVEFEQLVKASPDDVASTLTRLVEAGSPRAHEFAAKVFARNRDWTSGSPAYATCLEMVIRLGDVSLFFALLRNVQGFEFQPKLRDAVVHFGWETCLPTLVTIGQSLRHPRSRINLTTSLLHGETDPALVAAIFGAWDVSLMSVEAPKQSLYSWRPEPVDPRVRPTADEFTRVLQLALCMSRESLAHYTFASNDDAFIKLLVPAFEAFASSLPTVDPIVSVLDSLCGQLRTRLPGLRNAPFSQVKVDHDCVKCNVIQLFLSTDSEERGIVVGKHKTETKHLESVLKRTRVRGSSSLSYREIAPFTFEMTKQFGEDKLYQAAVLALQRLEAMLSSSSQAAQASETSVAPIQLPPLQPPTSVNNPTPRALPPLAAIVHTPLAAAPPRKEPEIIVIDDSD